MLHHTGMADVREYKHGTLPTTRDRHGSCITDEFYEAAVAELRERVASYNPGSHRPPARCLLIGDGEQHVGVARFIEWAVAREVEPAKLPLGVRDRDRQPAGQ
jgi:hypothetical protein